MNIPEFKREFTTLNGEDYDGNYHHDRTVKIVGIVPTDNDEEVYRVETDDGKRIEVDSCELHPHPTAPPTNEEFIAHFMKWTRNGALGQGFLIEAICKYAEQVINMPQEQRDQMDATMLPYAPWLKCAEEAHSYFTQR